MLVLAYVISVNYDSLYRDINNKDDAEQNKIGHGVIVQ